MEVVRYDGTRFITEEEIDEEFTGQRVLISFKGVEDEWSGGYLIASADGSHEDSYCILSDIAVDELDADAMVVYGCKERGMNMHVELLG